MKSAVKVTVCGMTRTDPCLRESPVSAEVPFGQVTGNAYQEMLPGGGSWFLLLWECPVSPSCLEHR